MNRIAKTTIFAVTLSAFSLVTWAQSAAPAGINQRKENQQQRIGQGVENGSLTAGEASKLEHKEAAINREQRNMKKDGSFTAAERAKIQRQQNHLSRDIYNQKHDAQVQNMNPQSEIGKRQRAQQQRIGEGIENGSLNAREAARLQGHEARQNQEIRRDRIDGGGMSNAERAKINRQENRDSKRIYRQKHDAQRRR